MQKIALALLVFITLSCQNKSAKKTETEMSKTTSKAFYVGTYTDGTSEGIYKYALKEDGTLEKIGLVAKTKNPSFLALTDDSKFLVAANENERGEISSFEVLQDSLQYINSSPSGGAHPCFVAIDAEGHILTANYTGGNVGLLKIDDAGKLSDLLFTEDHEGKGDTERQDGPHAHSAWFVKGGNDIISVDLGTNSLWFSTLDAMDKVLVPKNPQQLTMAAGAGPRHLVFHPNEKWIYVLNELNGTVSQIEKENGTYSLTNSFPSLPDDFEGENTGADIHLSLDGKFLYASNRGHDSIAIFSVDDKTGALELLGHKPVRGEHPRNFSISPEGNYLVVANRDTNNLVSFKRDSATGMLEFVDEIKAPKPVCVLFN